MREVTDKMLSIFGDRWYPELQWNAVPEQHELNQLIIQIADEYNLKLVSTADSHYPNQDAWKDRELYKRLGWIGKGKPEWLDMNLPTSVQEMEYEIEEPQPFGSNLPKDKLIELKELFEEFKTKKEDLKEFEKELKKHKDKLTPGQVGES